KETRPRRERPRQTLFEIQTQCAHWRRRTAVEGDFPHLRNDRRRGVVYHRIRKRRLSAARQRGTNTRSHAALGKVLKLCYFPALPESPALFNSAKASFALKSPVISNDSAPLAAVFPFTPGTLDKASFTVVTHLLQQRCTPATLRDFTFPFFAPLVAVTLMAESLDVPK